MGCDEMVMSQHILAPAVLSGGEHQAALVLPAARQQRVELGDRLFERLLQLFGERVTLDGYSLLQLPREHPLHVLIDLVEQLGRESRVGRLLAEPTAAKAHTVKGHTSLH
jgi:hypothetical protein